MVHRSRRAWPLGVGLGVLSLLFTPPAHAGSLYINGVQADSVRGLDMTNVNVSIDANGDIRIDAPHYQVKVLSPSGTAPQPAQPAYQPPVTQPPVGAATPSATTTPSAGTRPLPQGGAMVPPGRWWLVTEDNNSTGHTVDVYVGGVLVKSLRSGEPQVLMDIGPYLRRGMNDVQITARAGGQPGGGVLNVYIGDGDTVNGLLNLNAPQIEFRRRSSDTADGGTRQFSLNVP